jgi:phosphodiesterase/alkaline phosphatase D-like protein
VTAHSVTINNLSPGSTYHFAVVSANSSGTSASSADATFQTTGSAPGPVITNVAASSITSGTALITWTTDQASSSQVNYGNTSTATPALVTAHSVMLSGLTPNTAYTFYVTSTNAANTSSTSGSYNFTTSTASAAAPVISYVAFWGVTGSGVTISWSTDVPSNTSVAFGTSNGLGQVSPVQTTLSNTHGVTLTGLLPSTTYYFEAQSADVNGNTGYSTVYSFTTIAGAPVVSNVTAAPAANNTASITWATSVPTFSYVQYGPSAGNYNRYSAETGLTATPQCTLSYVPSGIVHYQLVSTDANGNQVVTPDATFVEP